MKSLIQTDGEAMPKISRRNALGLMGGEKIPPVAVAAASCSADFPKLHDPLLAAISRYEAGCKELNALPVGEKDEDAAVQRLMLDPLSELDGWKSPALTREGALAALRFARKEASEFANSDAVEPMIAAALAYFESQTETTK